MDCHYGMFTYLIVIIIMVSRISEQAIGHGFTVLGSTIVDVGGACGVGSATGPG